MIYIFCSTYSTHFIHLKRDNNKHILSNQHKVKKNKRKNNQRIFLTSASLFTFETNAMNDVTDTEFFKFLFETWGFRFLVDIELVKLLSVTLLLLLFPLEHILLTLSELEFLLFLEIFSNLYNWGSSFKPLSFLNVEISFSNFDII